MNSLIDAFEKQQIKDKQKIFDWICFKVEDKAKKEMWMEAIAKVRLRWLGQNSKDYEMSSRISFISLKFDMQ